MNDQWHTTDGDWWRPMTDYQLLQMMLQTFSNRVWPTMTKQHLPLVLVRPSQLPCGEPTTCWLQETDKEYWRILMTNSRFPQYLLEGDRRLSRPSQKIPTSTDDGRRLVQYHFSYRKDCLKQHMQRHITGFKKRPREREGERGKKVRPQPPWSRLGFWRGRITC